MATRLREKMKDNFEAIREFLVVFLVSLLIALLVNIVPQCVLGLVVIFLLVDKKIL